MSSLQKHSYLSASQGEFLDAMYEAYSADPTSVAPEWQRFFEGFEFSRCSISCERVDIRDKERKVLNLIQGYRDRGHLFTLTNPVRERRKYQPTLDIANFDLSETDLDLPFYAGEEIGIGKATLREIIAHLKETYCSSIGAEYMYIRKPEQLSWLKKRMESTKNKPNFDNSQREHISGHLVAAVEFEKFLHTRFVGNKRFSLEGCETLIPALDALVDKGSLLGVQEFVIGMAHRGRLNVLANILKKDLKQIFGEFEEYGASSPFISQFISGDVKYHLGQSQDITSCTGKKVHLHLAANPSHLEAIAPVVLGITRGKQERVYQKDQDRAIPVIIHGDAAIAGQGIVYEVNQMSLLDGYGCGGTVHLILNNQIGFTTNYLDGRSSTYCTDIAKVTLSPVFHVNADDVEAVVLAMELALEFRQRFHKDVFIDLLGYRKYGHSEGDDPSYTQPILYKAIAKHPDPATVYFQKLTEGGLKESAAYLEKSRQDYKSFLASKLTETRSLKEREDFSPFDGRWKSYRHSKELDFLSSPDTGIDSQLLQQLVQQILHLPEGKNIHKKIRSLFAERLKNAATHVDWAVGELLAYASLLQEKIPVRLSGQDCERGTFSHRHAVVKLLDTEEKLIPLTSINNGSSPFSIHNSLLSEYGVMGFEFGYSMAVPEGLTIWEAQFGDFVNGAQTIIDEFVSSSESKWQRFSGLVIYLPHGFEGQGPDHSSARMERFLQLCSAYNMQIANCTTPANLFHILRRQIHRAIRKPLIIFTPKSLLRHPKCISPISELCQGGFKEVLDDSTTKPHEIQQILFCSGKIYYELAEYREKEKMEQTAIIRLEQLYPLPETQIRQLREKYTNCRHWRWVQEEPANMGAATFLRDKLDFLPLSFITRPESDSPAVGYQRLHRLEQAELIEDAFRFHETV